MKNNIDELVSKISELFSKAEREKIVIFGSSAIYLHGVDLGRKINDLDIFVSNSTFQEFSLRFSIHEKNGKEGHNVQFLTPFKDIEILKTFPGLEFSQVLKNSVQLEEFPDFNVGSLEDIIAWKTEQGRDKDREDINTIKKHLP